MYYNAKSKLIHYALNCDSLFPNYPIEASTNTYVSIIINKFLRDYGKFFKTHSFVYEYRDDIYSLIGYRILRGISELSDFSFSLYGKPQKTRKYIMKSQRIISKRDFSKILHKSTILISSYNPIYDVLNLDGVSNEFIGEYSPVRFFTPNEIETLRKFYGDPTFSHDYFKKDRIELTGFQNWVDNPLNYSVPPVLKRKYEDIPNIPISLVWIDSDNGEEELKKNCNTLNEVEQSDGLIFYYFTAHESDENEKVTNIPSILLDLNYHIAVAQRTNTPNENFGNLNQYRIPVELISEQHMPYQFYGDWPRKEKDFIENMIETCWRN